MMPAFSPAIRVNVSPSTAVWSYDNEVMTETLGVTMLVASSRPPKPTSKTAAFTPYFANAKNASAVVIFKGGQLFDLRHMRLDLLHQLDQLLM